MPESMPLPTDQKYITVVADCPWPYNDRIDPNIRGAEAHYSVMTVDDIKSMSVSSVAAEHAHLYMWCTNAFMREAYEVVDAWGFVPKTILTWVKVLKDAESALRLSGDPNKAVRMGMGRYWRNSTEHVIFAVRGKPTLWTLRKDMNNVFFAPRTRHSEKPDVFYERVREMSPGPRLELFARKPREGFVPWGDEVGQ